MSMHLSQAVSNTYTTCVNIMIILELILNIIGITGAQKGTLTFMVGAQENDFKTVEPLLNQMGKNIVHAGPNGSGLSAKIANNLLLAIR